jgi:hypothetical protein
VISTTKATRPGAVIFTGDKERVALFYEALGGRLSPAAEEWRGRGFRACEAIDPDGNPIQFREDAL